MDWRRLTPIHRKAFSARAPGFSFRIAFSVLLFRSGVQKVTKKPRTCAIFFPEATPWN
jgi:hypothetical protein